MTSATNKGEKRHTSRDSDEAQPAIGASDRQLSNERWTIRPNRYRQIVFVAGILLALIVLTGAAVRLTESGLGCEDWPTCNDDQVVPEWQFHGWIEFGNRLLSGVVAASVGVAALASYRRRPRREALIPWAWGLVAVVFAQVLLGGVTVLLDLHPLVVGLHFLLSMLLLWNVVVLWVKADPALDDAPVNELANASNRLTTLGRIVFVLAAFAGWLGTLVTGTGPHGGDARADRLPFDLQTIARVHSAAVWLFLASAVITAIVLHRSIGQSERHAVAAGTSRYVLLAAVAQGAVGYAQYLTGVPALLVELHIFGAIMVWVSVVLLHQRILQTHH